MVYQKLYLYFWRSLESLMSFGHLVKKHIISIYLCIVACILTFALYAISYPLDVFPYVRVCLYILSYVIMIGAPKNIFVIPLFSLSNLCMTSFLLYSEINDQNIVFLETQMQVESLSFWMMNSFLCVLHLILCIIYCTWSRMIRHMRRANRKS